MVTRRPSAALVLLPTVVSVAMLSACAVAPQAISDDPYPDVVEVDPAELLSPEDLEALGAHVDSMPSELNDLMIAVTSRYQGSDGFSGFEWVREEQTLRLWWFGDVPSDLADLLVPHRPVVVIEHALNSPRELAAAVQRITAPGAVPGVFVSAAGPSTDCSHLTVMAEPVDSSLDPAQIAQAIEAVAGFPIELEIGRVVPISGTAAVEG